jgi:hypothetical protein
MAAIDVSASLLYPARRSCARPPRLWGVGGFRLTTVS